ncbi:hypothetical protein KEM56_003756 [Ascosphaera pollenicola]|nr:hypothetical protein KEM56_003756 [Ascosphaera pollenicola]
MTSPIYRAVAGRLPLRATTTLGSQGLRYASSSASSSATTAAKAAPLKKGKRSYGTIAAAASVASAVGYFYFTDNRSSAHRYILPPLLRLLIPDGERAHVFTIDFLKTSYKYGFHPRERGNPDASGDLMVNIFGYNVLNPIGIAAGLDKNADAPDPFLAVGPGIVEVGGITPLPQPGNPGTRIFRIPSQQAIINRCGLNSKGADYVAETLRARVAAFAKREGFGTGEAAERRVLDGEAGVPPGSLTAGKLFAVQIAKNKTTPNDDQEAIQRDMVYCVERLGKYADILVVNVSCPNMSGLRELQAANPLTAMLSSVVKAAETIDRKTKPFVMVKVSPDQDSQDQLEGVCAAVWASGVHGVIVGNTTSKRPAPLPETGNLSKDEQKTLAETGGFSGPHLVGTTINMVARYRQMIDKPIEEGIIKPRPESENVVSTLPDASTWDKNARKVFFASGGITNARNVLDAQKAGAKCAMIYTTLVYNGIGTITRMKSDMRELLKHDNSDKN